MSNTIPDIRPHFNLTVPHKQEVIMERIRNMLEHPPEHMKGKIVNDHVILDITGSEVHFWSPQLNFRIEQDEYNPEQTIVAGLIGPRPPVWTMFMFFYFGVGTAGFFISMFGFSKWMVGNFHPTVLALPLAIIFMLSAYAAGKIGEKLGAEQVELLKQFIRDAIYFEE